MELKDRYDSALVGHVGSGAVDIALLGRVAKVLKPGGQVVVRLPVEVAGDGAASLLSTLKLSGFVEAEVGILGWP